jgi:hypothetical protein
MPRKAIKDRPMKQSGSHPYDPYLYLALQVIKQATFDKDVHFFQTEDYEFWLGYVQACLPGQITGKPLPRRFLP